MSGLPLRVVYLGTPLFAVPTLKSLIAWENAEVVALVTQEDKPVGRKHELTMPPTKVLALEHNIPVFQPKKISKSPETLEALKSLNPDLLVMVAFGQILRKNVLTLADKVINLHGSLLPAYRGPAPINWAIINGDNKTGVTTMYTDEGVDTGDMLLKREMEISPFETAQDLAARMSEIGAQLVIETLEQYIARTLKPEKQDDASSTYAPMLTKELASIDWKQSAEAIHNRVRGLFPWPGTTTKFNDEIIKIISTRPIQVALEDKRLPGTIVKADDHILVACGPDGQDCIELIAVQPANRNKMKACDWVRGSRILPGDILSSVR